MPRLASSPQNLKDHYTVVVIGSGYGGGIAASRLARARQQVCLLERGREFMPGDFPASTLAGAREMQFDLPKRRIGRRTGLYDFRVNEDINVVLGCGLGGTSLINANVSLPAEDRTFDDPHWPAELRGKPEVLRPYYERAAAMLKPAAYPQSFPALAKTEALRASAKAMGQEERFYRPPINVNFTEFPDGLNHVGVFQQPCKLCGDCVSGCNHSAKNTTLMNYLPDAHNHGAEIYTQVSVRFLERQGERWLVHYQLLEHGRPTADTETKAVSCDVVVLAAGTLGSTEILLRSQQRGLALSNQIGERFTGNGDMMAFGYNGERAVNAVGFGRRPLEKMEARGGPVGPCIAGIIDMRERLALNDGFVVQDGTIPGPLAVGLPAAFAAAAATSGRGKKGGGGFARKRRELESLVRGAYRGAVRNTQTYLVMSHDDGAGRMYLDATGRLRIAWKDVGRQAGFGHVGDELDRATGATGGTYVKNPTSTEFFKNHMVTVHPLGGCAMGDDAGTGVVNHKSQVFDGESGTAVHEGLYVCDGAVVPRCLGVNPLLTISALAERSIELLARDRGWEIDFTFPSQNERRGSDVTVPSTVPSE